MLKIAIIGSHTGRRYIEKFLTEELPVEVLGSATSQAQKNTTNSARPKSRLVSGYVPWWLRKEAAPRTKSAKRESSVQLAQTDDARSNRTPSRSALFTGAPIEITPEFCTFSLKRKSLAELTDLAHAQVAALAGRANLIVLADPAITLTSEKSLRQAFPNQAIVGYGHGLKALLERSGRVMIWSNDATYRARRYQELKRANLGVQLFEPPCEKWLGLAAAAGGFLPDKAIRELVGDFQFGTIVLYSAVFWDLAEKIDRLIGWRVSVTDLKKPFLYDVCKALKLKGADGLAGRDRR